MCGRYFLEADEGGEKLRVILEELNRSGVSTAPAARGGEIAPSQIAPVIVPREGGGFTVRPMLRGFPRWDGEGLVINSGNEKAHSIPMFQKALGERRCLMPASGFYGWRHTAADAKTKQKYAFTLAGGKPGELMLSGGALWAVSGRV